VSYDSPLSGDCRTGWCMSLVLVLVSVTYPAFRGLPHRMVHRLVATEATTQFRVQPISQLSLEVTLPNHY